MLDHHGMKPAGDILSFGVVLGSLAQYLPAIAALASIVWSLIRIYETETVQKLLSHGGAKISSIISAVTGMVKRIYNSGIIQKLIGKKK